MVSDQRATQDVNRQCQVANELPNHGELLKVLFAESRQIGSNEPEKASDDGCNAAKESWAIDGFKTLSWARHFEGHTEIRWVHFMGFGEPNVIGASCPSARPREYSK